jgi:hypothetical protein
MDRHAAETTPTPVVEAPSARRSTLETHLELLRRAERSLARMHQPGSCWSVESARTIDALRAELAKWERRP